MSLPTDNKDGTDIPLRVLLVEDSEDDAALLVRELIRGGYAASHRRVDTPDAFVEALDTGEWDVIFGDYSMPKFSGTQALSIVRARGLDIPFIIVSGTIGEDLAVSAMRAGAHDYITKDSYKRLVPAVERELREVALRREQARAEAERRAAEERFRNILTIAADAIIAVDENYCISLFNQGAEHIFGYRAEEIRGESLDRLLPLKLSETRQPRIEDLMRAQNADRLMYERREVFGRRKNGEEFSAEVTVSKLTEQERTTFTIILRDISERKRTEQGLRLLQSITQAAVSAGDSPAALEVALVKVCETTGWKLAQAWVPDASGERLECSPAWYARGRGFEDFRSASLCASFAPGEGLPGRVWLTRRAVWLHDVAQDPNFPRANVAKAAGLQTAIGIPVLADEQEVVAVMEFFGRERREIDARLVDLITAVAAQLGSVIQRKRIEDRLHYLAHHDALTGLPNRVLFTDRLRQAMLDADRHQRLVGVAFIDLDRFKVINDSLGHTIGDRFLKAVGERLVSVMRTSDTVARLAGDEFTMVLADMGHVDHAPRMAQNILDCFARPFTIDGHELHASASLGITLYPHDGNDADDLLRNADLAMYRAKERGGRRYEFHAADMTSKAHARLALENELHHALERQEFELHYQPVVDLTTGRMTGVEALLRWRHPERGLVPPLEFISLAEETGLIIPIGEWVLRTACMQWRESNPEGLASIRLAVNVSPRQFDHGQLLKVVTDVLDETGFDPHRLDLEITETLLMQHAEGVLEVIKDLNALGVQFSIDDFGTGYSSLGYLKTLPIGRLKIDRSFVRDIPADPNDVAIVGAIISMAHNLELGVIAEGVETAVQIDFLRAHRCNAIQGYYYSPPVLPEEILRFAMEARILPTPGK